MTDDKRDELLEDLQGHVKSAQAVMGQLYVAEGESEELEVIREPLQQVAEKLHYFIG